MNKIYLCIDLKTFYASVECATRNLDPFNTNLVVADPSRGNGAICLAITPKLKAMGIKNRCRIYEIPEGIEYITALPRMKLYIEYAANIYAIYLKYVSKDDIHVYSIDEAFLDITPYLHLYGLSPQELASKILADILESTKITATCGIGTNLFLAKVALDILAKHDPTNIAYLDQTRYLDLMSNHQPITDFWHVGNGIAKRLLKYGIEDMEGVRDIDPNLLIKEFGVNGQYLIDHAYGNEPTTIADIKKYSPTSTSMSNSQILFEDYLYDDALLVLKEMVELNALNLVAKNIVTSHIYLSIGYSKDIIPRTNGSLNLGIHTNSYSILLEEFIILFKKIVNRYYPIRSIALSFSNILDERYESYNLFSDIEALEEEKQLQKALVKIKSKYGKNAVLKGMNLLDKATTKTRNELIGGHHA